MTDISRKLTLLFLWLTIFTIPFQKSFIIPGIGSINKLMAAALVLFSIYSIINSGKVKKPPLFFILSLVFIGLNICSYFWATVPQDALEKSLLFLQVGYIAWAIFEFTDSMNYLKKLIEAFVLGCSVIAFQSLYQFITEGSNLILSTSRFYLEGYNPNELGVLWVLGFIMAVYLIINGSKIYAIYIPLSIFTILLTGSRSALVILFFVVISSIWMLFKYKIKYRKTILVFFATFGVLSLSQIPKGQLDRLSTIRYELAGGTLNGRTDIWKSGLQTFGENPFLGVGGGSFLEATLLNRMSSIELSAHNAYLSVLVENGIFGFIIFILMLLILVYSSFKIKKVHHIRWLALSLIFSWLIISLVSHSEAQKYTWVIFGLISSSVYISRNTMPPKNLKQTSN